MSNIKPISLTTTAGEAVFTPNGFPAKDVAEYFDTTSGIPVGYPRIRITTRRGNANQDPKVVIQLDRPVLAETSPSTATGIKPNASRAFNQICKLEFYIPRSSSLDDRTHVLELMQALTANDTFVEAVQNLDFPY